MTSQRRVRPAPPATLRTFSRIATVGLRRDIKQGAQYAQPEFREENSNRRRFSDTWLTLGPANGARATTDVRIIFFRGSGPPANRDKEHPTRRVTTETISACLAPSAPLSPVSPPRLAPRAGLQTPDVDGMPSAAPARPRRAPGAAAWTARRSSTTYPCRIKVARFCGITPGHLWCRSTVRPGWSRELEPGRFRGRGRAQSS